MPFLVGVHDELDDEEMVAVNCPECVERQPSFPGTRERAPLRTAGEGHNDGEPPEGGSPERARPCEKPGGVLLPLRSPPGLPRSCARSRRS